MNIACLDSNAQARINLQKLIEGCFDKCRESTGHLLAHKIYPISFQELLLSSSTDVVILGPELTSEHMVSYIGEINKKLPDARILVLLKESSLSLISLKRFEELASAVLTEADSPIKILHAIESLKNKSPVSDSKIIYFSGTKGGVGTTSLCTAFAHAAQNLKKKTLLVDLSTYSNLSTYLRTSRSSSTEFASYLLDSLENRVSLSENLVLKMIEISPCGLELLLPPSTKRDIRDIWLRDPNVLDQNLAIFEILKSIYDIIIIDGASAEGIFPFSLISRSDHVLVTSTSAPASIHLLSKLLEELSHVPGKQDIQVIINSTSKSELQVKDIKNLIKLKVDLSEIVFHQKAISFESRAKDWIGTGNSFYTEANNSSQELFDKFLVSILEKKESKQELLDLEDKKRNPGILENYSLNHLYSNIAKIFPANSYKTKNSSLPKRKLLPHSIISSRSKVKENITHSQTKNHKGSTASITKLLTPKEIFDKENLKSEGYEKLFKKAKLITSASVESEISSQENN